MTNVITKRSRQIKTYIYIYIYIYIYTHTHIHTHIHIAQEEDNRDNRDDDQTHTPHQDLTQAPSPHQDLTNALKDKPWDLQCTREFQEALFGSPSLVRDAIFGILGRLASGDRSSSILKRVKGTSG